MWGGGGVKEIRHGLIGVGDCIKEIQSSASARGKANKLGSYISLHL